MSENSAIGWTDATLPIIAGCNYKSPGCSNCWSVRDSWRLAHNPHPQVRAAFEGTVRKTEDGKLVWTGMVRLLPERLAWPLTWRKGRKIFWCSQSDLFDPQVPFEFIAASFGVMAMATWHTHQVLTKEAARIREFFGWLDQQQGGALETCLWNARQIIGAELANNYDPYPDKLPEWPLENVWLGVTVEDQKRADERIPELLRCPAAVRWLSVEPMLEAIDLKMHFGTAENHDDLRGMLHWLVVGGESAQTRANTRPFDLAWARDLRDQCKAAGVAYFLKQLGTKPIWDGMSGPGQHWPAGTRRADTGHGYFAIQPPPGKTSRYKWHEPQRWPEDLRVQSFPE